MGRRDTKTNQGKLIINQSGRKASNDLLASSTVIRCSSHGRAIRLQFVFMGLLTQKNNVSLQTLEQPLHKSTSLILARKCLINQEQ